jgi:hypothetical protein
MCRLPFRLKAVALQGDPVFACAVQYKLGQGKV